MVGQRKSRTPVHERASQHGVLAAILSARREELNLRQDELAELADCSTRFVHALESGKPTVQLDKLLAVLAVLGLHLEVERGHHARGIAAGPHLGDQYQLDTSDQAKHP